MTVEELVNKTVLATLESIESHRANLDPDEFDVWLHQQLTHLRSITQKSDTKV